MDPYIGVLDDENDDLEEPVAKQARLHVVPGLTHDMVKTYSPKNKYWRAFELEGHVNIEELVLGDSAFTVAAEVESADSFATSYKVWLNLRITDGRLLVNSKNKTGKNCCTCPDQHGGCGKCKHMVATLIEIEEKKTNSPMHSSYRVNRPSTSYCSFDRPSVGLSRLLSSTPKGSGKRTSAASYVPAPASSASKIEPTTNRNEPQPTLDITSNEEENYCGCAKKKELEPSSGMNDAAKTETKVTSEIMPVPDAIVSEAAISPETKSEAESEKDVKEKLPFTAKPATPSISNLSNILDQVNVVLETTRRRDLRDRIREMSAERVKQKLLSATLEDDICDLLETHF